MMGYQFVPCHFHRDDDYCTGDWTAITDIRRVIFKGYPNCGNSMNKNCLDVLFLAQTKEVAHAVFLCCS